MDEIILDCAVVQDLAALYTDGGASEATAAAVSSHLKSCTVCREYYKKYMRSGANRRAAPTTEGPDTAPAADGWASLARRLRRRSALETGGAMLGGFVLGALALAAFGFGAAALLEKAHPEKQ
ncbi:MAG: zf-HC2 domain-containing protein [Oscillospiraceae bacterium]|nr:zf-HC2 domain-containing protein [Oscillospiraceae bacterium]